VAPVIALRDVSLWRRTQEEFHYDFKRFVFNLIRGRHRRPNRRRVLDNVSLTVRAGEKIGIIGENGSGKTTLLKVICGILAPTNGSSATTGSVAPLIELGAGFDSMLSLVDNIVYYGLLLGIERRRMREHVDSILDFAELRDYRDEPVKTLSSGMTARLGFAIATEFRPDILILDEVLAVGDESFARKCRERIDHLWDEHVTILVVSHNLDFILKECDRAIWLEKGALVLDARPHEAVLGYKLKVETQRLSEQPGRVPMLVLAPLHPDSKYADRSYAYFDGRKHLIADHNWLKQSGLEDADVIRLEDDALDQIPEGQPAGSLSSVSR
jgi:ABC-type polysaccharide/polyol phosphate transport system ATPase subunit